MTPWTVEEALRWADTFGPSEDEAPTGNEMALAALACEVRKQAIMIERLCLGLGHELYETVRRMTVAAIAHRGCCSTEHEPEAGKLYGYCVVCGVPWPCETAQAFLFMRPHAEPPKINPESIP